MRLYAGDSIAAAPLPRRFDCKLRNLNHSALIKKSRPALALLLGVAWVGLNASSFTRVWQSLSPPIVYYKDCISPYLMAKATLHGVNPYLPLPQLAKMWLQQANPANHPTPYPPFVALLSLPLSFLSYEVVVRAWMVLEILYVLATILLLLRWWGTSLNPIKIAILLALAIVWMPLNEELWQGQFMSGLMLLLVGAWLALRSGRHILGGALLGALIAIKMTGAPIVLFFMLRRQWRVVFSAAAVVLVANLLAMAVLGSAVVINYYREVASLDAKLWRPAEGNLSVWAWGIRLFEGAGFSYHLSPLWAAPKEAAAATYLIPAVLLALGVTVAWRAVKFDTAFSWLVAVSILFSPIAWYFYLLLAVIPMVVLARRLTASAVRAEVWMLAFIFWSLLSIPPSFFEHIARSYGTPIARAGMEPLLVIPFAPGLLTLLPVAGLLGLMWLVSRTDGVGLTGGAPASSPERPSEAMDVPDQ